MKKKLSRDFSIFYTVSTTLSHFASNPHATRPPLFFPHCRQEICIEYSVWHTWGRSGWGRGGQASFSARGGGGTGDPKKGVKKAFQNVLAFRRSQTGRGGGGTPLGRGYPPLPPGDPKKLRSKNNSVTERPKKMYSPALGRTQRDQGSSTLKRSLQKNWGGTPERSLWGGGGRLD